MSFNYSRLIVWGFLGVLYSLIMVGFSPWLLHYVPEFTVVHSLYFGLLFAFLGFVHEGTPSFLKLFTGSLVSLIIGAHFFYWLYYYSVFRSVGPILRFSVPAVVVLFVVALGWLFQYFCQPRLSTYPVISTLALFFFLGGEFFVITFIPTGHLLKNTKPSLHRLNPVQGSYSPLYPFTISTGEGVYLYPWLTPEFDSKKRIFFLLLDAFRDDYFGKKMYGTSLTPSMDKLAKDGIYFSQYRVQSSWTKPSTASLFTGLYPGTHGVIEGEGDMEKYTGHAVPERYSTLAERLQKNDFTTYGAVMTPHISDRYQYDQGFEMWLDPGQGYKGDFYALEQMTFWLLREDPGRCFVYLHLFGPHQPFIRAYDNVEFLKRTPYYRDGKLRPEGRFLFNTSKVVDPLKEGKIELTMKEVQYLRHMYASQLNYVDKMSVKPFLKTLKLLGLYSPSLITVTGDHGEELYDHQSYAHGRTLYEEVIHPPLIIKFPGSNTEYNPDRRLMLESIDLTATLLDFGNQPYEDTQGNSFLSAVRGKEMNDSIFRASYSQNPDRSFIKESAVVRYPWKLIHNYFSSENELYNLEQDPLEQHPLDERGKIDTLRQDIYKTLGSDSLPENVSIPSREATKEQKERLKGLGYIE